MKVIMIILLVSAMTACGGSPSAPTGAMPATGTSQPPQPVLAQFSDPVSGSMTTDVRDVDEQIVRFDTKNQTLIWAADGRTFQGFTVNGNIINVDFQVRFGTKNGERRAYFTETARPFICNIEITNGQLSITATNVPVP